MRWWKKAEEETKSLTPDEIVELQSFLQSVAAPVEDDVEHVARELHKQVRDAIAWKNFKATLREFKWEILFYACFVAFFSASVIVSRESKYDIQLVNQLKIALLDTEFSSLTFAKTFYGIGNGDDFWAWMRDVLVPTLFDPANPTYQYCVNEETATREEIESGSVTLTPETVLSKDDANATCYEHGYVLGSSILAGPVRVRQVRVKKGSCQSNNDLTRTYWKHGCYGSYHANNVDTEAFTRANNRQPEGTTSVSYTIAVNDTFDILQYPTLKNSSYQTAAADMSFLDGFVYASANDLSLFSTRAWVSTYEGGGYTIRLPRGVTSANFLRYLDLYQFEGWVDVGTRLVSTDFTAYNAPLNQFVVVRIHVEFLPGGGCYPYAEIHTAKLFRYTNTFEGILTAVFDVIVILMAFCFMLQEFREMGKKGLRYFVSFWNMLDFLTYTLVITAYCLVLKIIVEFPPTDIDINDPYEYGKIVPYVDDYRSAINLMGVTIFLLWFKIFKYTTFVPGLMLVTQTLEHSVRATLSFVSLFAIILVGFAMFGTLSFGEQLFGFEDFAEAYSTLLLGLMGGLSYQDLRFTDRFLGPFFYALFTAISVFVLLTMFFAILSEAYEVAKARSSNMSIVDQLRFDLKYSKYGHHLKGIDKMLENDDEEAPELFTMQDLERIVEENKEMIHSVYGPKMDARTLCRTYGINEKFLGDSLQVQDVFLERLEDNLPSSNEDSVDYDQQMLNQVGILRRHVRMIHAGLHIRPSQKRGLGATSKRAALAFEDRDDFSQTEEYVEPDEYQAYTSSDTTD